MNRGLRQSPGPLRHVLLTLAMVAVALKVLAPPGFMVAPRTNDLPFAIVLCTPQGAIAVDPGASLPDHGEDAPDQGKAGHDSPCAFAGHGLGAAASTLADAGQVLFAAYDAPATGLPPDLRPGRGLTGPPLPARGPPSQVI